MARWGIFFEEPSRPPPLAPNANEQTICQPLEGGVLAVRFGLVSLQVSGRQPRKKHVGHGAVPKLWRTQAKKAIRSYPTPSLFRGCYDSSRWPLGSRFLDVDIFETSVAAARLRREELGVTILAWAPLASGRLTSPSPRVRLASVVCVGARQGRCWGVNVGKYPKHPGFHFGYMNNELLLSLSSLRGRKQIVPFRGAVSI